MTFDSLQVYDQNYHENSFTVGSCHTRLRCVIQQETILEYMRRHILPLDMFDDLDFDDLRFDNPTFRRSYILTIFLSAKSLIIEKIYAHLIFIDSVVRKYETINYLDYCLLHYRFITVRSF